MDSQNTNFIQTNDIISPAAEPPVPTPGEIAPPDPSSDGDNSGGGGFVHYLAAHKLQVVIFVVLALFAVGNLAVSDWLYKKIQSYSTLSAVGLKKVSDSASTFNGDNTLYINTQNKGVGVGASSPDGLQVNSSVTNSSQSSPNVRIGLLNGEPAVILEGKDANQWEFGVSNASLQLGQLGTASVQLDKNGFSTLANTTLGKDGNSSLTIQSSALSVPNNLNIGNNALFVDSAHGSIAIGANSASGFKLLVNGTFKANGAIQSGGQITGVTGSASAPAITFAGNTSSGVYSSGSNSVSISAGGSESLRVQQGVVSVIGGNLSVSGYIGSGGGPNWQVARYTGTLDGSGIGSVNHGISSAPSRVIMAMAWYQSGGQAKPLAVDFVDGNVMQVAGGSGGAAWRGMIMYTSDAAGW